MAKSSDPKVLYLLTDELSSVLVRGQLGYLGTQGFDVTVACRLADPSTPKVGAWDDGVTVEHLPFTRQPAPLADLRALWATIRLIRRVRPGIVNASTPKAGLIGTLAAWTCRVPTRVYLVRGLRFETATGMRRRLLVGLDRVSTGAATRIVWNSASLMAVGERAGLIRPGRGEVIGNGSGNGIDIVRFDPMVLPDRAASRAQLGLPVDARIVGFVGRFTRDKGIAELVRSIAQLRISRRDLCLLLAGDFEDGDPVDAETRTMIDHEPWIHVVPWLDHTGVAYQAMNVLAFPSYREGLPNVPLEAQACGVPVVGYAASGTVDAVSEGETGLLVPVGDAAALTSALAEVLETAAWCNELGAAGRDWVQSRFDRLQLWQGWAERYRAWQT